MAGVIVGNTVSVYEMRNAQTEVQRIVQNTFTSIDLAASLSRSLHRKRVLLQTHILEMNSAEMEVIEGEMRVIDKRIEDTLLAYEPIADEEGERAQMQRLRAEIAEVQPQIDQVIQLSRQQKLAEARRFLAQHVERPLETISETTDQLVRFQRARSEQEISMIRALQRQAVILLGVLGTGAAILTALTATWVTRLARQREREMREAAAALEERNRELDAFAGRVAHDLRGPLTSISLATALISRDPESDDRGPTVLRRGVAQMEAIIQNLLTLSRVSSQTIDATCQAADVALSVEEDLKPRVEEAGGALRVNVAPAAIRSSEGLLRQVLWNLGENAVKYRRLDTRLEIDIRGRLTPHGYEFVVADNGSGMSLRETRQAFEPFFRGERARQIPGAGLGLSIVERVVEASNGSISVESAVGQGTTFRIHLPLALSKAA
jgi:signal transduction histidine kinase